MRLLVLFGLLSVLILQLGHASSLDRKRGQAVSNGGRVLCATAMGDTVSAAQQRAYELSKKISWQDSFYRTDIGYRAIAREQK